MLSRNNKYKVIEERIKDTPLSHAKMERSSKEWSQNFTIHMKNIAKAGEDEEAKTQTKL